MKNRSIEIIYILHLCLNHCIFSLPATAAEEELVAEAVEKVHFVVLIFSSLLPASVSLVLPHPLMEEEYLAMDQEQMAPSHTAWSSLSAE